MPIKKFMMRFLVELILKTFFRQSNIWKSVTLTSVLKIQTLLRNDDESEVENEEYYFEENDVKTEEYYGEVSFQQSLSERSYEALKLLIPNVAYDSMKKSTDL